MTVDSVAMFNQWVGHARPKARQIIGPVDATGDVPEGLGRRVQDLVAAGLIVAVWKQTRDDKKRQQWEWIIVRTRTDLPACWPLLRPPLARAVRAVRPNTHATGAGR